MYIVCVYVCVCMHMCLYAHVEVREQVVRVRSDLAPCEPRGLRSMVIRPSGKHHHMLADGHAVSCSLLVPSLASQAF